MDKKAENLFRAIVIFGASLTGACDSGSSSGDGPLTQNDAMASADRPMIDEVASADRPNLDAGIDAAVDAAVDAAADSMVIIL